MKIAIVHDWLVTNAGAEKVLKEINEIFPDADIFSLVDFLSTSQREGILGLKKVKTSFIQKLPFASRMFRYYLPLFPKAIESLDIGQYDVILSSSWAVAKGVKKSKKQLHICYCHTPIRYAWDLYDEYISKTPWFLRPFVSFSLKRIRSWDVKTHSRVDYFIANSNVVKDRIQRIYGRESTVIFPPADIHKFVEQRDKKEFYLTVSRLVSYKKIDLIVKAFNGTPHKKLVVIGGGDDYKYLKSIANSNVSILGAVSDELVIKHMQDAKAFVFAAEEDFGIVSIEAQACGTPVIAYGKAGSLDTVQDQISGVFFYQQTEESIKDSISKFETLTFDSGIIRNHAIGFSNQRFQLEYLEFVKECGVSVEKNTGNNKNI